MDKQKKSAKLFREIMLKILSVRITRPIVFFDVESTGTNVDKDQIIQINLQRITKENIDSYTFWIMSEVEISKSAFAVHGISKETLIEKKAKPFNDYAVDISNLLIDCDISGYNLLRFDLPILENELYRAGIDADFSQRNIIDISV